MHIKKQASEIAREALIQLNVRKLAPTPANYQACYNEIAKLPNVAGFPEAPLRKISLALKGKTQQQRAQLEKLDAAIGHRNWNKVQDALVAYASCANPDESMVEQVLSAPTPVQAIDKKCLANLAFTIETLLPALGRDDSSFLKLTTELLHVFRDPPEDVATIDPIFLCCPPVN